MEKKALPEVLLGYQRELLRTTATNSVVVYEKSRRIGVTWGVAADAVLNAASARAEGGMDVFYIGFNLDMTREFIDVCAMWAKAFVSVAVEVHEFMFKDQQDGGADREIKAFRISFASGFEIVALCSRPRAVRGRQGYVIIDEAAFHDELEELLKAAFALLIWGGKVLVISTHDGVDNPFNQLVQDVRAGRRPYAILRTTFDNAIADGLYRRVCLTKGQAWAAEAEQKWTADIRKIYGDAGSEELDVVPRASTGKYLARTLLEARARAVPVLRWVVADGFVDLPEDARIKECEEWCEDHLRPLIDALPRHTRSAVGEDFGRTGDLTVIWPLLTQPDLTRTTPFTVELRNCPFTTQAQVLHYLCDRLPSFSGAALDARGNGQYLAEVTRQRYGAACIAEVMLSEGWYREQMPPLKSAFEDGTIEIPQDAETLNDFRAIELVHGVARVVDRTQGASGKRHGDSAIACALAFFASRTIDAGPITFAATGSLTSHAAWGGASDGHGMTGWNE